MARTLDQRFWEKVEKTENCWLWLASTSHGYGSFRYNKKLVFLAHRLAYEMLVDQIPDGMHVLHTCDNPRCVNPAHLFLGTDKENVADKVAKGRQYRGSRHHLAKLTDADIPLILADTRTYHLIAARYGVDRSVVSEIKCRKAWKHVGRL